MDKAITRFELPRNHPLEESEAHYVGVHVPLARIGFLREPSRISYVTQKVVKQYDYAGGWNHRLTAWRFVTTLMEPTATSSVNEDPTALSHGMALMVKRDIPHCIRGLQRCPVTEEILFSATTRHASNVRYLFEYDRFPETSAKEAKQWVKKLSGTALARAESAFGLREITVNWVRGMSDVVPQAEEGQFYVGTMSEETNKVAYLEFVFDSEYWAEKYFETEGMAETMLDPNFAVSAGYQLQERLEFDRR